MRLPSRTQSPTDRAAALVRLMEENAQGDYIGESISQLEHSLQCAHLAAKAGKPRLVGDKSSSPALLCFPAEAPIENLTFAGSSNDTVVAALFHDIGQFLPAALLKGALEDTDVGRPNHASTGSVYLAGLGFPAKVTNIVAQHVASKRYLTATDATYMDQLSDASKKSLRQQGGPMNKSELSTFEEVEGWRECLEVRKWDDQAKLVGIEHETPRAASYEDMIASVLVTGGAL
jgi:predicted HD phosphohydrolase